MWNRREVLVAAGTLAASSLSSCAAEKPMLARAPRREKLRIFQVGVGGSIAPTDRGQLASHPDVVFTGFCDVDRKALDEVSKEFPDAFTCKDFRQAFADRAREFDAVLVCVPDHNHAAVMLHAMRADKHVYGQKPLVQQLSEVVAIEQALVARPELVTQVGNQRMGYAGRQYAVEILRRRLLGKAVEAHVWVDGPPDEGNGYFYYGGLKDPTPPPDDVDWQLWLGCARDAPHREGLVGLRWRSSWEYGTGQLGDWCTHLLDVLYFAYDLGSPKAVISHTRTASDFYHAQHVHSVLTYAGGGMHGEGQYCARPWFSVHYCDKGQTPSRAALGLPLGEFPRTGTLVVCEEGVLFLEPEGQLQVWQDGREIDWKGLRGIPECVDRNHWHSWVDTIQGREGAFLQSPFSVAAGMAEAGLLCAKAARFPGRELVWDKSKLVFSNHQEATDGIVRREYRAGFEL